MATNIKGKCILRAKPQNGETLEGIEGIDSEIDSDVEDEEDQL